MRCGATLDGFTLAYETYGKLNDSRSNAILVFHAMTGSQHAAGINANVPGLDGRWTDEMRVGWWDDFIGPGKAELLGRIAATGSIAAAARDMGMSYKRAWMIVETLNAMFDTPLVDSARGGPGKGGATLTPRGRDVLAEYQAIEAAALDNNRDRLLRLQSWLRGSESGQRD
jgi:molybdate transport repressor ModE-like protein